MRNQTDTVTSFAVSEPAIDTSMQLESRARSIATMCFVLAVIALVLAGGALAGFWHALDSLRNDQRVVFVKLTPDGGWTINPSFGPDIDFYTTTIESILAEYVEACFSQDPRTIEAERAICYQFQPNSKRRAFLAEARTDIQTVLDRPGHIQRVRVRQHRHDTFIPTRYTGSEFTYKTTSFATEYRISDGDERALRRLVIDLTWRFRGRRAIQAEPSMLRINPLAIEVIEHSITIDTVGDDT